MRHGKKIKKLGRSASHRKAMLANMAASLFIHKRIKTTEAKAKEARRLVERLITYGKKQSIHARRLTFAILRKHDVVKMLFDEIAPVYADRAGGYTRIYKLGRRPNDAAKVVLLELVDFVGTETTSKKDKDKKTATKTKKTVETPVVETKAVETAEIVEETAVKEDVVADKSPAKDKSKEESKEA